MDIKPQFAGMSEPEARSAARKVSLAKLQGQGVANRETGRKVVFSRGGLEKATSAQMHTIEDYELVAVLPNLIEEAVLVESMSDLASRPNIRAVYHFNAAASVGGQLRRLQHREDRHRRGRAGLRLGAISPASAR